MSTEFPPSDHGGEDLSLQNGDVIWGLHDNIGKFEISKGSVVIVRAYDPITTESGKLVVHASHIAVHGMLDASGSGYTGGGGSAGAGGKVFGVPNQTNGINGQPGQPRYSPYIGSHLYPQDGDGPYRGVVSEEIVTPVRNGGYNTPAANTDETTDTSVLIGSGGAGMYQAVGSTPADSCTPIRGRTGGGGGGPGGGSIELYANKVLHIDGEVATRGHSGSDGTSGTSGSTTSGRPPCFVQHGDGGNGGNGYGNTGNGQRRGGSGAGGGMLLYCPTAGGLTVTGTLDARGGRNGLSNGGTVKIFASGPANGFENSTVLAARVYKNQSLRSDVAIFDFLDDENGWSFQSVPSDFDEPLDSIENTEIRLTSRSNNCYGFWESKKFDVSSDPIQDTYPLARSTGQNRLYQASYLLKSTSATMASCPILRLRATSADLKQSSAVVIDSRDDGIASPSSEGKEYKMFFFLPPSSDQFSLCFEMLNFHQNDDPAATVGLDRLEVVAIDDSIFGDLESVASFSFDEESVDWSNGGAPPEFALPGFGMQNGKLAIFGDILNTFGYWTNESGTVQIDPSQYYVAKFEVSSSLGFEEKTKVPTFRCRLNESGFRTASMLTVDSMGDGSNSPSINELKEYQLILTPSGVANQTLVTSLDYLNFHPDDDPQGRIYLSRVSIYKTKL